METEQRAHHRGAAAARAADKDQLRADDILGGQPGKRRLRVGVVPGIGRAVVVHVTKVHGPRRPVTGRLVSCAADSPGRWAVRVSLMGSMKRQPILITGSHRSGTTWLGHLLDASDTIGYIPTLQPPVSAPRAVCRTIPTLVHAPHR